MSAETDELSQEDLQAEEAGFGGEESTEDIQTQTPEPEVEPDPAPEPKYAQITEEQLNVLLAKAAVVDEMKAEQRKQFDSVNGHIGGMKQMLQRAQESSKVEATAEDLAELQEQFPEISELVLKGMQNLAGKIKIPLPNVQQAPDIEKILAEHFGYTKEELIDRRLNEVVGGDWRAETRSPDFVQWAQKQSPYVQNIILHSKILPEVAEVVKAYKAQKPAPKPTAAPTPPAIPTRQKQLAAAVNPRSSVNVSSKRAPSTEEAAFDEAIKSR